MTQIYMEDMLNKKLSKLAKMPIFVKMFEMIKSLPYGNKFLTQKTLKPVEMPPIEPLLTEEIRLVAKPINPKYKSVWDLFKKQQEVYWTAEEIKYTQKDIDDFNSLKPEEQKFLKSVLAFFASSDGIVNYNLRERFLMEFKPYEVITAYTFQMMMEGIHGEVYSDLILNIIKEPKERDELLYMFQREGSVKKMSEWAYKWIDSKDDIGTRIIAFAIVEGVFFSGMFACIFWLKKNRSNGSDFLNAIVKSNRFISRDEGLHVKFACEIYSHIVNKVDKERVIEIMKSAVEISNEFMVHSIECEMIGMNRELMERYIKYVGDMLMVMLGYDKIYNVENPFDFMDTIALHNKDNFFEHRPDAYQSAFNDKNKDDDEFKVLNDF